MLRFAITLKMFSTTIRNFCLAAGYLLMVSAGPILNAQESSAPIDDYKKEARDIQQEIKKSKAKFQQVTRKETDIILRLNQADRALNRSRKRIAALSHEIDRLDKKITATGEASENLIKRIKANAQYVDKRLVALYKLAWLGRLNLLASAESLQALLQRQNAIARILAYDQQVIKELMDSRRELEKVRSLLEAHRDEKHRRADAYQKQVKRIADERTKRAKLLAHVRQEKSAQLAAIESLKRAAKDLDEQIKNLGARPRKSTPEEFRSGESFGAYKGLLKMPVKGKIISHFGTFKNTRYNVLNFRSGIEIQTERGEPIQAVYAGKVLYSEWFKGYGNMIIIDHGKNYYTVYAHIEEAFKSTGDSVESGEVIATVGDTGSLSGPKLYFEVRHHGNPLDPMQWLEAG